MHCGVVPLIVCRFTGKNNVSSTGSRQLSLRLKRTDWYVAISPSRKWILVPIMYIELFERIFQKLFRRTDN